jgi:hypothetical protein
MSYRKIIRKHAAAPDSVTERGKITDDLETMSYRDLQQRAIDKGISGKQTAEALREALRNA